MNCDGTGLFIKYEDEDSRWVGLCPGCINCQVSSFRLRVEKILGVMADDFPRFKRADDILRRRKELR